MDASRERENTVSSLQSSVSRLEDALSDRLISGAGLSFGFAMRGARDKRGVAAVPGGIRIRDGEVRANGPCAFDSDEPVVTAILTAMKFDPAMRSAAVFPFSERILSVLEDDLFLECASFSAAPARQDTSTMDWGIAFCCKKGIPDVIYEKKADMAQSRILLFGEDPADVANNIIICSNRILNSEL